LLLATDGDEDDVQWDPNDDAPVSSTQRVSQHVNLVVRTLAGDGKARHADGPAACASFYHPTCVVPDASGLLVADSSNCCVRKISADGERRSDGRAI